MKTSDKHIAILGGGPAGLSAGKVLTDNNVDVVIFEKDDGVGGLSRTHEEDGFRFDLGGHRFFTKKNQLNQFLHDLLPDELIMVDRSSKIYLRGKYFNYPPTLINAFFGFGPFMATRIILSFLAQRLKPSRPVVTLEDAIVRDYGRVLYEIFFEPYNEKIWGGPCSKVDAQWLAQRIKGLSLINSIRSALSKNDSDQAVSLIDKFIYPRLGIGRISKRLKEEIEKRNRILLEHKVEKLYHESDKIVGVGVIDKEGNSTRHEATEVLSSIPITELVRSFDPPAPPDVIEATYHLAFRDLIVVDVRFDRPPITNDTWIYIPERHIMFGRIHEPTNWSADMSPEGKTSLVFEYWCNEGDALWNATDDTLVNNTIEDFVKLRLAPPGAEKDIIGATIVRCRKAYPMYVIGYEKPLQIIKDYLSRYSNLMLIGRYGTFMYNNMDHAIETGIRAAENVLGAKHDITDVQDKSEYMEEVRLKA